MTTRTLRGKTAWVTGGASGIGRTVACSLRDAGAEVALFDLRVDGIEKGFAAVLECDVASPASVQAAAAAAEEALGPADILVTSAGISGGAPVPSFPDDLWSRLLAVNLTGTFHFARRVLGPMCARRFGRIVLIGSDGAVRPMAGGAGYAAAKAGVAALGRVLAIEGGPYGVTCNVISPGIVDTPMSRRRWTADQMRAAAVDSAQANVQATVLEPVDIAGAALFLCQDSSRHITGQTIHVNGGAFM